MILKVKYALMFLMSVIISDLSAQNSQVLYYMNLPQNHLLNPALKSSNSLYIGLPVVSGINLNVTNNFINLSDIYMKGPKSDSIILFLDPDKNINDLLSKIKENNNIEAEASVQLFGLGFSVGKSSYVFLDINDRVDGNMVIPKDFFELALKGNGGFVGSKMDLSSLRGDIKYYREIGLCFSKDFTSKLRIGIKGKLLFGIAAATIENRSLGITVQNVYNQAFNADMAIIISAPIKVVMDADNKIKSIEYDKSLINTPGKTIDYLLGKENTGMGFDIGATYDISQKFIISAAITDLGFIKWKRDINHLKVKSDFRFTGLDMGQIKFNGLDGVVGLNGTKTIDQVGQEMLDSLANSFIFTNSKVPFTTSLPFGVTLGGSYNLTKSFSLGLLSYSRIIGKQINEALTLSANVNFGNAFSTSLSYTAANYRYDNFGAGIAFRPGIFQFYILADRLPIMWNKIKVADNTIPLPDNWNTINLRLGMNLSFGNRTSKKNDKPMVQ
jgi:hypothetical protein